MHDEPKKMPRFTKVIHIASWLSLIAEKVLRRSAINKLTKN